MYELLQKEEIQMSYTVEDFKREVIINSLHTLSIEERLKGLQPEDIEILKNLLMNMGPKQNVGTSVHESLR
jgi:hypothetical protein